MVGWVARVSAVVVLAVACGSAPGTAAVRGLADDREDLTIVVKPREPRPDVFVLKGWVEPRYAHDHAILQRRNCGACRWFAFERFRTDGSSRFKRRVPTPGPEVRKRICYRVKIARSADHHRAISTSHCIGTVGGTTF